MLYVGLGAWCQVAHQLEKNFGEKFIPSSLDWTVTPLLSIPKIFDSHGENFGNGMFIAEKSKAVECEGYGILYRHEFHMDENMRAIFTEERAQAAKVKLQHKHKKMIDILSKTEEPVIFVRYGGHALPAMAWPYLQDLKHVSADEMNSVVDAIERALPNLNFRLLFIRDNHFMKFTIEDDKFDPRIVHATIPHPHYMSPIPWTGNDEDWIELLSKVPKTFSKITRETESAS